MWLKRTFIVLFIIAFFSMGITAPIYAEENLPAFPGAEGGGKYTKGARGADKIEVYHVNSLEDSGKGTLRDAVSEDNRIIVFDVSGTINLNSRLSLSGRKNITILGQTAPGNGITITGGDILIERVNNVIIRYLRIRPGDENGGEPDGLGGRWVKDVILDHCSVSWGVDELLTLYAGSIEKEAVPSTNVTVQYCISSESLRMSNHFKGAHGYGGIIGGTNATYHHNLFAHNDSRNPRLDRNLESTDMINNVIYNWGNNSCYGGEPYSYNSQITTPDKVSNVNIRNNYYKYGPSTKQSIRSKIFEVTNNGEVMYNNELLKSNFYISGNYVYGDETATQNNTSSDSYVANREMANFLDKPIDMGEYEIPVQSAQEAYEDVLANAGASLPVRDSIDARIIADVKNGTGRIINSVEEVGGIDDIPLQTRVFEIPAEWKEQNNMGSAKETDIVPGGEWKGYTWIEAYVNDWTQSQSGPSNPDISVISPAIADTSKTVDKTGGMGFWTVIEEGENVAYKAEVTPKEGTNITKTEIYDCTKNNGKSNVELVKTVDGGTVDENIALSAGIHYLMCRAYNDKGEITASPASIVYVTGKNNTADGIELSEIGSVPYPQKSGIWVDGDKTYISGSGAISGKSDSCTYGKYAVTGDFEFSVKIGDIPKYENGALCGIMIRESLEPDSRMVMLADGWKKYGENIITAVRAKTGADIEFGWLPDENGKPIANGGSYQTESNDSSKPAYTLPQYMKISRTGDILTLAVSDDGTEWDNNCRRSVDIDISGWSRNIYAGLAVDSVNTSTPEANPMLPWYTVASFSDIKLTGTPAYEMSYDKTTNEAVVVSPKNVEAILIMASYDGNGTLIDVDLHDREKIKEGENRVAAYEDFKTGEMVKVFLWDNLKNMNPMETDSEIQSE